MSKNASNSILKQESHFKKTFVHAIEKKTNIPFNDRFKIQLYSLIFKKSGISIRYIYSAMAIVVLSVFILIYMHIDYHQSLNDLTSQTFLIIYFTLGLFFTVLIFILTHYIILSKNTSYLFSFQKKIDSILEKYIK